MKNYLQRHFVKLVLALGFVLPAICLAEEEVRLGALFSLSGYGAVAGEHEMNAVRMAVDDINAAGGISGKKLKVIYEDSRSDFKETASAFNKLVAVDRVPAIIGPNWAEFAEVVAPLADKKKVVILTSSAYSDNLTKGKKYVFTTLPSFPFHVRPLADRIIQRQSKKVLLLKSSNAYFDGISEALKSELEKSGSKLWKEENIRAQETDFRTVILNAKEAGVDAVVLFLMEGAEMGGFLKQAHELHFDGALYSSDLSYYPHILQNMNLAEGVTLFQYRADGSPEFLQRYRDRFKVEPNYNVPKAYDNVFMIKQAMEQCGFESAQIRECLLKNEYRGISGVTRFSPSGNIAAEGPVTTLATVLGGEFKPVAG